MKHSGMTVNERLWESGLMKEYDDAVKNLNTDKVKEIIKSVELDEKNIIQILKYEKLLL